MIRLVTLLLLLSVMSTIGNAQWMLVAPTLIPQVPGFYGGQIKFSAGILWAGSSKVFISRDTGMTWVDVTPPTMTAPDIVHSLEVINGTTAIISTHQQRVLKTTDGGITWARITIPSGSSDYVNFMDNNPNWLVASRSGFVRSLDGGVTWSSPPGIPDFHQMLVARRN